MNYTKSDHGNSRTFKQRIRDLRLSGENVLAINGVDAYRASHGNALIHCPSPDHIDRHPSCSVELSSGRSFCFSCRWRCGDIVALHRGLCGASSMGEALRDLGRHSGTAPTISTWRSAPRRGSRKRGSRSGDFVTIAKWTYFDALSRPAFEVHRQHLRFEETAEPPAKPTKRYIQTWPGGSPIGLPPRYTSGGKLRPLYGLLHIVCSKDDEPVYVTEGEKAADALIGLGLLATTSSGGAGSARHTDWSPLAGREVILWPDTDLAGADYAKDVVNLLAVLEPAPRLKLVIPGDLGLPEGGDAADWVAMNGDL